MSENETNPTMAEASDYVCECVRAIFRARDRARALAQSHRPRGEAERLLRSACTDMRAAARAAIARLPQAVAILEAARTGLESVSDWVPREPDLSWLSHLQTPPRALLAADRACAAWRRLDGPAKHAILVRQHETESPAAAARLTAAQVAGLQQIIKHGPITNAGLAHEFKRLGMKTQHQRQWKEKSVGSYVTRPLRKHGLIELTSEKGRKGWIATSRATTRSKTT